MEVGVERDAIEGELEAKGAVAFAVASSDDARSLWSFTCSCSAWPIPSMAWMRRVQLARGARPRRIPPFFNKI